MSNNPPLNDVQLMLLRLFSKPMSEQQIEAIRVLLLDHYEQSLDLEVTRIIEEKSITDADIDQMLNKQKRK